MEQIAALLYSIDTALLYVGNSVIANPVFDIFFAFITRREPLLIAVSLCSLFLIIKGGKRGILCVLMLFLSAGIADRISSGFIKPAVNRARPCHDKIVREVVPCGPGRSFPSSHASNTFAAAMVAGLFYRRSRWYVFSYAGLVSFSRVYCGAHYPSDITAGALLGAAIGYSLFRAITVGGNYWQWLRLEEKNT